MRNEFRNHPHHDCSMGFAMLGKNRPNSRLTFIGLFGVPSMPAASQILQGSRCGPVEWSICAGPTSGRELGDVSKESYAEAEQCQGWALGSLDWFVMFVFACVGDILRCVFG